MRKSLFPVWRSPWASLRPRLQHMRQQSLAQLDLLLAPWLPAGLLSQTDTGRNSRDRVFTVRRTFYGFLYQVLNPKCSCRQVVRQIQALFALQEQGPVDENSSAYCQARRRLPLHILQNLRVVLAGAAERSAPLWHGLRPKVVDGTTLILPDTPKNQLAYPQSRNQKPGCGFPLLKLVGLFSLSTGVLLSYAKGNKHQSELGLLKALLDYLVPGDLAVADRGFCSYALIAWLRLRGVHSLMRLHHSRCSDLRKGKPLGKRDRLITWHKPDSRPPWLPQTWWKRLPSQLTVRLVRYPLHCKGYRQDSVTLMTTLLDPQDYPAKELAQLYLRRWNIELWLRDIKTTMGMEELHCRSPRMVHKELEMFFIAYNTLRCLIVQASLSNHVPMDRISFKGTVDSLRQFSLAIAQAKTRREQVRLIGRLLEVMARDQIPKRPGRREPRAVKRRPKSYERLNRPRRLMKEIPHRHYYPKTARHRPPNKRRLN